MKWFKHDSRANRDAKIEKLMNRFGADGYALYWLCIELIVDRVEADCLTFELEHDAETLGARLKVDTLRVEEIMKWMVFEGLFEGEGPSITCFKIAKRLDSSIIRSPELAKIQANIRASKRPGTSGNVRDNPGQSVNVGERPEQIRLEETRREEKKEENTVGAVAPTPREQKHRRGEFSNVLLTETEEQALSQTFGAEETTNAINFLSEYIEMKGYKARSHYLAIRKWVFNAIAEERIRASRAVGTKQLTPAEIAAIVAEVEA